MIDPKIINTSMSIINDKLVSESKLDKLNLCQSCLAVAKIMMEDTDHKQLAHTINTIGMLIQDDISQEKGG